MTSYLQIAEDTARAAHKGQLRRGGMPYIMHVRAVVEAVTTDDEKAVAWLHDVLEDTAVTAADLFNAGIPFHIVEAVKAITKEEGEPYGAYMNRVKANLLARIVKTSDMRHNLSDKPSPRSAHRYRDGIKFLAFGDVVDESRAGVED